MSDLEREYQRLIAALQEATRVCVIAHLRPDADAIGSATALSQGLRQLGKETEMLVGQRREISSNLMSIPGATEVRRVQELPEGFDLYVTVDCGSLDRTGYLADALSVKSNFACVDHHASNPGFAAINVVDTACESTTVVLIKILDALGVTFDQELAHCLYAGLMTDTGSFRWGRPQMHDVARRLIDYGLNTKQIAADLLDSSTATDLLMKGKVLATLQVVDTRSHRLAVLLARETETQGASEVAVESLVDQVRVLEGTQLGVVFKEFSHHRWTVSLRSATVDCAAVATFLGGGGHVGAAGYSTSGSTAAVIKELVRALEATHQ
ncbi:exopolyphosphatase [Corynebacterium phocae]|uniref:Exopolyphosphatase n=1 Tax=Corynebacterium phocae TaxID=161895 RepID=A0A1L7D2X3_9CORY|nr:DHH family phosphoesterase [Corynebacterium phocae]APT92341.1 exopolyphosphatase [Corynebacterium phocae]KAA8724933.1 bifunctional oligoribonuclease/PAP phosphatase NrnA [Corynebacterium phocae]